MSLFAFVCCFYARPPAARPPSVHHPLIYQQWFVPLISSTIDDRDCLASRHVAFF